MEAVDASPALSRDAQDFNSYKESTLGENFDETASEKKELRKGRYSIYTRAGLTSLLSEHHHAVAADIAHTVASELFTTSFS